MSGDALVTFPLVPSSGHNFGSRANVGIHLKDIFLTQLPILSYRQNHLPFSISCGHAERIKKRLIFGWRKTRSEEWNINATQVNFKNQFPLPASSCEAPALRWSGVSIHVVALWKSSYSTHTHPHTPSHAHAQLRALSLSFSLSLFLIHTCKYSYSHTHTHTHSVDLFSLWWEGLWDKGGEATAV